MDPALRHELLLLIADDDATCTRLAADGSLFRGYHPEMERVNRKNAARLREIIALVGWPGRSIAGEDGASAAWRIVQHAISEPSFLRATLPLLEAAAARGEANPAEVAMLVDRIRAHEGRPQLYGTQYDWDQSGTKMVLMYGVEDAASVDARRSAVGLPPIQWTKPAPLGEPPPADLAAREAEMIAWAKRVGWR